MKRRYFSAESAHSSGTSRGFSNDTIVLAFDSKKARDAYVDGSRNLSCEAIKFSEVTKNAANWSMTGNELIKPEPFTSEFWGIADCFYKDDIQGLIGQVIICNEYVNSRAERLYR